MSKPSEPSEQSEQIPTIVNDVLNEMAKPEHKDQLNGLNSSTGVKTELGAVKTKAELIAEAEAELATAGEDEEKKKAAQKKLDAARAMPDDGKSAVPAAAASEGKDENTTTGVSENIPPATMYNISNEAGVDPPGTAEADKKFIYKSKEDVDKARADQGYDTLQPGGGRRRTRRHHKKGDKKSRRQSKKGGKKHRKSAKKGSSKSKRSRRYSSRK